jgi:hypothetical protein
LLARGARGLDGRNDAAARAGNFLVARALKAQFELLGPVAAKHQMGMAIDEPRRDPAALAIDAMTRLGPLGQVRHRAGVDDAALPRGDRSFLDQPEPRQNRRQRGKTGIRPQRIEIVTVGVHRGLPHRHFQPIVYT